jgi:hypothetical protein
MSNAHPVKTNITISTATFQDNSEIPVTDYGDEIPVKIVSHDHDGDSRSVTVMIGNKMFPVSEIEFILKSVTKHLAAVKTWNNTKA